ENFSLLLFDLASAINSGQVLDMRQENGMKSFEARLATKRCRFSTPGVTV
ncbi:hypothetical protein AK812_SmicGene46818, partial [Symbiodinium microadriaticum]